MIFFLVICYCKHIVFFILPYYLLDLYRPIRALRSANKLHLDIPKSRLKTKGDQALQWLPLSCGMGYRRISGRQKLDIFKSALKTHLFSQAFGPG